MRRIPIRANPGRAGANICKFERLTRVASCANVVRNLLQDLASNSRMTSRSTSDGAVAASMAAAGSSTKRQAFAGDLLIHRASSSPQCFSACSSCSDSLIGGKCAKEHLSSDLGCLDTANGPLRTEKFMPLGLDVARPYKTQLFVTGLRQSLQGFQNSGGQTGFVQTEQKS